MTFIQYYLLNVNNNYLEVSMANNELQLIASNAVVPQKTYDNMGNPVITTPEGNNIPVYLSPFNGRIVQPGSIKNNKDLQQHIRKFYFPDLDISVDHLELVPVMFKGITRTLFPPFGTSESTQEPICRSSDGLNPDMRIENPMCLHCASIANNGRVDIICEYAKWKNNTPAACQMSKLWIFYDINLNIPFYWQLKSTSLSAFNKAERDWKKQIDINRFKGISSANDILYVTFADEGTYVKPEFKYVNNPKVQDIAGIVAFYRNEFANDIEDDSTEGTEDMDPLVTKEELNITVEANSNNITATGTAQEGSSGGETKKDAVTLDSSFVAGSGTPF